MIKSLPWHILEMEIIGSVLKFSAVLAEFCHGILWVYTKDSLVNSNLYL